jgi:uncharacterized protein DUF4129
LRILAQAAAQDSARRWATDAIHDTVAAIARQPAYSTSIKRSLFGRFLNLIFDWLRDLRELLGGSRSARLIVMVAVASMVIVIVARIVVARRIDQGRTRERGRGGAARTRTDSWARARELATAGDHVAACHALYAAVVDDLARAGALRFHPSKTSGDYARELARRSSRAAPNFLVFARQFEHIAFGTGAAGADDFARLASAAERVRPAAEAA